MLNPPAPLEEDRTHLLVYPVKKPQSGRRKKGGGPRCFDDESEGTGEVIVAVVVDVKDDTHAGQGGARKSFVGAIGIKIENI